MLLLSTIACVSSALAAIGQMELYHGAVNDTVEQLTQLGLTPTSEIAVITEQLTREGAAALVDSGVEVVIDASSSPAPNGHVMVDGRRLHLLHAMPCRPVRDRHRDPGPGT